MLCSISPLIFGRTIAKKNLFRNVYCPNTLCPGELCVNKKTFKCLEMSDQQCPQFESTCQFCNIPFEEQTNSSLLKCDRRTFFWRDTKINSRCFWRFALSNISKRIVSSPLANKKSGFYVCKKCKICSHLFNIPCMDQKPTFRLFGGDGTYCFAKKTIWDYEKMPSPFLQKLIRQSQSSTPEPLLWTTKMILLMAQLCRLLIGFYS